MDGSRKLTVSELTGLIRASLEGAFSSVVVEGELSNCRPSSTGHLYFTLKDAGASISAVMFKNRLRSLAFEPKDGILLRVRGSVSVYPPRGSYQIVCEEMEQAGAGEILALLEKRKRDLAAEGLFDEERKRPIPRFPSVVGVVSSPTGAAVRDILNVLGRRAGGIRVIILPAPVQGNDAAPIIARRIRQANQWKLADVLIVGRGGGALEDLLPFSDEAVVRAVAASAIPVVSAVGHEIDWALSDFAADLRAHTPSAAAEMVSENREAALEAIRDLGRNIRDGMQARLERARLLVKPFSLEDLLPFSDEAVVRAVAASQIPVVSAVGHEIDWALSDFAADLRAPTPSAAAELVSENREAALEAIRNLGSVIVDAMQSRLERARLLVKPFSLEDLEYRFRAILQPRLVRFDDAKEGLLNALSGRVGELRRRLELALRGLEAGSPLAIMARGFSLVVNEKTGKLLHRAADAKAGDRLSIRPLTGRITAVTEAVED
ncbi:MAG: exodeoxyribonuclease VII large subunit [Treponema sp.]|jgi:exodeoxyribonuclease VII large subunit|nr:exodeoxyribonuclease VII large subunit [Treponema sp.]